MTTGARRMALCWLNEDNLGDVVIRDCVLWLLDRCAARTKCPVDIVSVDIGGAAGRSVRGGSGSRRRRLGLRKRLARVARALSVVPFFGRLAGALAEVVLVAIWRRSARYRMFAATERPKLFGVDAILFAGGGLVKFRQQDFNYMLFDITELADSRGIPVFINATGVEGFDPRDPECRLLRVALNRRCVKSITTRDDLELLSRAYVWRDGIEISRVCDPALWVREAYGIARGDSAAGAVGVNVVRLDLFMAYGVPFAAKEFLRLYVELVRELVGRGHRVVLFTNGSVRDARALEEVSASCRACLPDGTIRTVRPHSPQELATLIAGFSRFVAVRLHASIVGTSLGVPNASLVWNRKQLLFGRLIGMEENFLSAGSFDTKSVLAALDAAKPCAIDADYKDSVCRSLERKVRAMVSGSPVCPVGADRNSSLTFARRALLSLFNGMFVQKAMRHLLKPRLVHRPLEAILKVLFPVNSRKVVCMTFSGALECNPKYIASELARRGNSRIVWLIGAVDCRTRSRRARALGYRTAPIWSLRALYHIVTAGVWVDNAQMFAQDGMPRKRPGQRYLNTWHGSLGIKRLESADGRISSLIERAARETDAVLVNSDFEERVFSESVFPRTPKLRFGHPRNDVFFRPAAERAEVCNRVRAELGLAEGEKFALYAPTFREVAFFTAAGGLAFERWAVALGERFGGTWRIVLRLHPHDAQALAEGLISVPKGVCDASSREDIQELLVAADAGITDYSSWIFDYLLGGGPGFVFAPDKAKYDESRGFYYPLGETPFPVAESEDALCAAIRAFDASKYAADRETFLRARGCYERGDASARAADWIEGRIS